MHRRDVMKTALLTFPLSAARSWAAPAPVVLELFTSQGCSSCPPADALLGELVRRPGVIGLAWHVDYWNNLGWRDPYARPEWTERQRTYARYLQDEVYTPALVVNGAAMAVGSDQSAIQRAIDHTAPPAAGVTLRRTASGLAAEIGPLPAAATGILVSYDPHQSTRVGAGENGGRQLVEYRVVRDAIRLDVLTPRLVLSAVPENRGAVLLIQDASWHVIGVADLPPVQGA
jgi:hypothetical protein